MNFTEIRSALKEAELYRHMGKIDKIIGMTVESTGRNAI